MPDNGGNSVTASLVEGYPDEPVGDVEKSSRVPGIRLMVLSGEGVTGRVVDSTFGRGALANLATANAMSL